MAVGQCRFENPFLSAKDHPLSTFSIDVDTASYSNVGRFLREGQLPPFAQDYKMIQALLLKCLNKSLDVSSREQVCFDSFPGVFEGRFVDRAATRS
jgi:hypothetical protein